MDVPFDTLGEFTFDGFYELTAGKLRTHLLRTFDSHV
jgi:hypothetical protein